MRKVIAAINMTLDGYCDHTEMIADEQTHQHYTKLLTNADTALYGRITFQLMKYWQTVLKDPAADKDYKDFALAIDTIPKIVFSHTLKNPEWESAKLAYRSLQEEILALKKQPGKDILVGSPGLIVQATNLHLIDEYQLCVHPVVAGQGLPLFRKLEDKLTLKLLNTKIFNCGAVILYYRPVKK
jgi:dihydrofolate reductase